MTYSTVGWNSGLVKPQKNELFLVAVQQGNGEIMVFHHLYMYDLETDSFIAASVHDVPLYLSQLNRNVISYWAYVPRTIDLKHGEGKQSQVPEEK